MGCHIDMLELVGNWCVYVINVCCRFVSPVLHCGWWMLFCYAAVWLVTVDRRRNIVWKLLWVSWWLSVICLSKFQVFIISIKNSVLMEYCALALVFVVLHFKPMCWPHLQSLLVQCLWYHRSLKTMGSKHPVMVRSIPGEQCSQLHHFETLESHKFL